MRVILVRERGGGGGGSIAESPLTVNSRPWDTPTTEGGGRIV